MRSFIKIILIPGLLGLLAGIVFPSLLDWARCLELIALAVASIFSLIEAKFMYNLAEYGNHEAAKLVIRINSDKELTAVRSMLFTLVTAGLIAVPLSFFYEGMLSEVLIILVLPSLMAVREHFSHLVDEHLLPYDDIEDLMG